MVGFVRMAREQDDKLDFKNIMIYGSMATFLVALFSSAFQEGALVSSLLITAVYALVTAIIYYVVSAAGTNNLRTACVHIDLYDRTGADGCTGMGRPRPEP